ncbi:cytochrome P450 monooxygenase [Metarhizium album ARSEF 1941]|uniref:Cytochrome P450 monooxygenase n=1 Tax=Metarhizium album (strain ARSEF 1941) TaxID=1081103 RepID=A0A0B2WYT2_METAS|nr:cytochrome P450 monooxygenase [Metarhizium album ARSEF 1941]KHO01442.1 cytochrome P450 monooxygenase [Metarhizium album ARSEF 1941]
MAAQFRLGSMDSLLDPHDPHFGRLWAFVLLAIIALSFRLSTQPRQNCDFTLANPPKWYELKIFKQIQFLFNGINELDKAREQANGKPFRLLTNSREIIVLPPAYAEVLHADNRLSFAKYFADEFDGDGKTPGLEPYTLIADPCKRVPKLVTKRLTRSLNTIPIKMSSEASFAIEYNFGGRVVNSIIAAFTINMAPSFARPLIRRFSPVVRRARNDYQAAREFIEPLINARREGRGMDREAGTRVRAFDDIVDWIDSENQESTCDPVALQMVLNVAAVHPIAALVTNTIAFLAADPSTFGPLRQELLAELRSDGCQAAALNRLKLLDSAIKESLRLKPPGVFGMHRAALEDMQLPNGMHIHKGDRVFVDTSRMRDPSIYESPNTYDLYRFHRMRSRPDQAQKAPLVVTSPEHLAFGHGAQACPGRFFAALVGKVVLSHLLLKYDWRLAPDSDTTSLAIGLTKRINPKLKLLYRRRKEEFELS